MNHFTTKFIRETRCALVRWALAALCFADFLSLHGSPPASGTNRFLFIVDTSAAMKNWEQPLHEAVFDFIYSGVRGAMKEGDSYGVWLAGNGTNDTSGTVETWKERFAVEVASRATARVKERFPKGKPALDIALSDAAQVARTVGDVTVIVVSNGDTPLRGTPFDPEIAARHAEILPAMREGKTTINTVLLAQEGKFVAWSVNSPDFLVVMPEVPERRPVPAKVPAVDIAKAPSAQPKGKTNPVLEPPVAKPRIASNPIVITRDTVEREKQAIRALASTDVPPLPARATNVAAATNAPVTQTASVVVAIAPVTNAPMVAAASAPAQVAAPATNAAVPISPAISISAATSRPTVSHSSAPLVQIMGELNTNEPAAVAPSMKTAGPASIPEQNSFSLVLWSAVGGALLVLIVVAVVFFTRSREPQVSLVTQAAMLERMRR